MVEYWNKCKCNLCKTIKTNANRVDGSAPNGTECASHTTERTDHVLGGSQRDGLSLM